MAIIKVIQEDINKGEIRDCNKCPIARALNRILNFSAFADIKGEVIYIRPTVIDQEWAPALQYFKTPEIALDFINNFDCNITVYPFEFELNIDPVYLK